MPPSFRRTLIYARVFQYLLKDKTYLFCRISFIFSLVICSYFAGTHPPSPHAFQAPDWNGYRSGRIAYVPIDEVLYRVALSIDAVYL